MAYLRHSYGHVRSIGWEKRCDWKKNSKTPTSLFWIFCNRSNGRDHRSDVEMPWSITCFMVRYNGTSLTCGVQGYFFNHTFFLWAGREETDWNFCKLQLLDQTVFYLPVSFSRSALPRMPLWPPRCSGLSASLTSAGRAERSRPDNLLSACLPLSTVREIDSASCVCVCVCVCLFSFSDLKLPDTSLEFLFTCFSWFDVRSKVRDVVCEQIVKPSEADL